MTAGRTVVVHTRLAGHVARVEAARRKASGVQIMTMEQLAGRLAGGFIQPIESGHSPRSGSGYHREHGVDRCGPVLDILRLLAKGLRRPEETGETLLARLVEVMAARPQRRTGRSAPGDAHAAAHR